jgi:ion channel-forming bestrophin family protein
MLANRRFPKRMILIFGLVTMGPVLIWAAIVIGLYAGAGLEFLRIPFLPLSTMGIAVAFYVGFKNNAAYDRFWEGRKIWGAVVNASRAWGTSVVSYIRPGDDSAQAQGVRRALVYRHLAWINALRIQLRAKSRFYDKPARATKKRLERDEEHMRNDWGKEVSPFLDPDEFQRMTAMLNPATHMLTRQGTHLTDELRGDRLDLFHQIAMMETITELYTLQGKCERIKNTPFPRLYAEYSRIFTRVFVYLVPLGLLDVFATDIENATSLLDQAVWMVPMLAASGLIAWVFQTMESIGDASEDPFERSMNDVPMNGLCRTIERDLRQMIGESGDQIPPAETPIGGVLY